MQALAGGIAHDLVQPGRGCGYRHHPGVRVVLCAAVSRVAPQRGRDRHDPASRRQPEARIALRGVRQQLGRRVQRVQDHEDFERSRQPEHRCGYHRSRAARSRTWSRRRPLKRYLGDRRPRSLDGYLNARRCDNLIWASRSSHVVEELKGQIEAHLIGRSLGAELGHERIGVEHVHFHGTSRLGRAGRTGRGDDR